jgi:hypothetical protein
MKIEMRGDKLVIEVDCSAEARARATDSKSGKTRILATTGGFQKFGNVGVSLNVTIPKE